MQGSEPFQLPIEALSDSPWVPGEVCSEKIFVTGCNGDVGKLLGQSWGDKYELVGVDTHITGTKGYDSHEVSVTEREALSGLMCGCSTVIHLATGVKAGWDGLQDVEINGTKNVLEAAVENGVHRFILASSLHSVGWNERSWLQGGPRLRVPALGSPRPDGIYGTAKSFAEGLARFTHDWTTMPVSIVRIGTYRLESSFEELLESEELSYLGWGEDRENRLRRTWVTSPDLIDYFQEELDADEPFRMRFATSDPAQFEWDHAVMTSDNYPEWEH